MKNKLRLKLLISIGIVIITTLASFLILTGGKKNKLNVLLITLDTTRADRIGAYGYQKGSTPNLDAAAENGITFENAFSQVPLTLPSHCSILTGTTIPYHKVRTNGNYFLPKELDTLAEILKRENYTTSAFIASFTLDSRFGLNQGFDIYNDEVTIFGDPIKSYNSERSAELVFKDFAQWFESNSDQPFFSWVHFYDPHVVYAPPEPYLSRFKDNPYDGEIAYMDEYVGKITALLKSKNILKNTLVVIVGDHGEAFGEHGEYGHQIFCYEENLRVPLIIYGPQIPRQKRVSPRVDVMDVMPTVLEYLDIPHTNVNRNIQGMSLMPLVEGNNKKDLIQRSFYFESKFSFDALGCAEIKGWVENDYKFFDLPKPELYHLKTDPNEKENIYLKKNLLAKKMKQKVQAHIKKYATVGFSAHRNLSETEKQRLESLGYLSSSPKAGKHDQSFNNLPDPKDKIESWGLYVKGSRLMQEKKNEEAGRVFLSAIESNPKFSWPYARLAFLYTEGKEFSKALKMFKEGIKQNPMDCRLKLDYANFLVSQSEVYDAFAILRELEKVNPPGLTSGINLAVGEIFLEREDFEEALPYLREVLRLEPANTLIKEKVALCLQNTNRIPEALDIYLELENKTPNAADLLYAIATLARKAGKLKLSESYFERLLKIDQKPSLYFAYAVVLSELDKYQKAVENIKIFLAKYPDNDKFKQAAHRMLKDWNRKLP